MMGSSTRKRKLSKASQDSLNSLSSSLHYSRSRLSVHSPSRTPVISLSRSNKYVTEVRQRETSDYHQNDLHKRQKNTFQETGKSTRIRSLDHLISTLPPLLPVFDLDKVAEYLVELGDLAQWGDNYVWNELKETPTDDKNAVCNEALVNVFSAIIHAAKETSLTKPPPEPTLDFITNVSYPPWSTREGAINPGGYLVLRKSKESESKKVVWYDIGTCVEFNESISRDGNFEVCQDVSDLQVNQKSIRNMQHTLENDPTRRYMYGISVEGTNLKLWLATRALIISCDSFDLRTKYRDLIQIFLSFSYASRESLGWDVAVEPERSDNLKYGIAITSNNYFTDEACLDSSDTSDTLVDPSTRVLCICGDPVECREEVIIEDRETDDDIHQMIVEDVHNPEKKEYYKNHTLSLLTAERVEAYNTKYTILGRHFKEISNLYAYPTPGVEFDPNSTYASVAGIPNKLGARYREHMKINQRNQRSNNYHQFYHRVNHKYVSIPLDRLTNIKDMHIVLVDVLKKLHIMHETGRVRRDISIGDLFLYTDSKNKVNRGFIGDYEYAKRVGKDNKHDIRAGTPNFMAIEVVSRTYHFLTPTFSNADFRKRLRSGLSGDQVDRDVDKTKPGIFHNYLHDLESLWWILVWSIFIHEKAPTSDDEDSFRFSLEQKEHFLSLFPGQMRQPFLVDGNAFNAIMSKAPTCFRIQQGIIRIYRRYLINCFFENEYDVSKPIFLSRSDPLHDMLLEAFSENKPEEIEVVSIFDRKTEMERNLTKRPFDEDTLPPTLKKPRMK